MRKDAYRGRLRSVVYSLALAVTAALVVHPAPAHANPPGSEADGELYIPEVDNDTVAVLDTATNKITHRIPIPALNGFGPSHPAVLAKSPDNSKIYVDNFGFTPANPSISIIDTKTKTARTIPVFSTPLGIFTSPDGKEIMIPELGATIEVLDIATDTIVRRFHYADAPAGAFPGPDGLVYVGFVSGLIAAIDPRDGHFVKPPIWSGGLATFWYTFTKDGKKLYTDTVNSIGVIDVESWTLTKTLATWEDGVGRVTNPTAFTSELSHDGTKLYVTRFGGGGVMVIDTATDRLLSVIPTEGDQIGMGFNGDGSLLYISDSGPTSRNLPGVAGLTLTFMNYITFGIFGPGRMLVVDTKTDQIIDTVPTEEAPSIPLWMPYQ